MIINSDDYFSNKINIQKSKLRFLKIQTELRIFNKIYKETIIESTANGAWSSGNVVLDLAACAINFLPHLISVKYSNEVLLIIFPCQLLAQFRSINLLHLFWVSLCAFVLNCSSVIIWVVVVFWNSLYCRWSSSFVFIYLISDFFLHLGTFSSVLVLDLFFQVFDPVFLVVVARELLDFHFMFCFSFLKSAFLFGFNFSFTVLKSLFDSSFFLAEELKVVMLLNVSLVVKFIDFISNFWVNSTFLVLAGYVIDTFLAVLLFNVFKAIIIAHDGWKTIRK